jgi:3'-phosphoadenosine 5'-phosphosulfate (PAPS) 3'-phosphatase
VTRAVAGDVEIGADAPGCVTNIVTAITADLSTVTAVDGAGDTVVITAIAPGVAGDSIVFTESSTNMEVDGGVGTLGGTTSGVNYHTFVVDTQTFTWKVTRAVAGDVEIGADAPGCVTNIVTAITADLSTVTAVDGAGDTVVLTAATAGTAGDAIVLTENSDLMTVDGAGTLGATTAGVDADTFVVDSQTFTWNSGAVTSSPLSSRRARSPSTLT